MRAVAILPVYVGSVYYNVGDELDYNGEPCGSIRFLPAEPAPAPAELDKPAEPAPAPAELDKPAEPAPAPAEPDKPAEPAPAPAEPDKPAEPAPTPTPSPRRRARE